MTHLSLTFWNYHLSLHRSLTASSELRLCYIYSVHIPALKKLSVLAGTAMPPQIKHYTKLFFLISFRKMHQVFALCFSWHCSVPIRTVFKIYGLLKQTPKAQYQNTSQVSTVTPTTSRSMRTEANTVSFRFRHRQVALLYLSKPGALIPKCPSQGHQVCR